MDWENGFAVSERKGIKIEICQKLGVFFCYTYDCFNNLKNHFSLQNETQNGTKSFSLQK